MKLDHRAKVCPLHVLAAYESMNPLIPVARQLGGHPPEKNDGAETYTDQGLRDTADNCLTAAAVDMASFCI